MHTGTPVPSIVLNPSAPAYRAHLYFLPDTGVAPTAQDFHSFTALGASSLFNVSTDGMFNGGLRTVPQTAPGDAAYFLIRVWDSQYGDTYDEVLSRGIIVTGTSPVLRIITGGATSPPSTPTPLYAVNGKVTPIFTGITLVPEPNATYLLAALAPLLFRFFRRKH